MGSFRLAAGRLHHHKHFNFTESQEETVWPSLCHSQASHPIRRLSSLQSAVFLVNSRSHQFSETSSCSGCFFLHTTKAHLIPKLRCQFAEFLLLSSLKRLSIFSSPTSVGLRYGPVELELRGFSWEHIQSLRPKRSRCFASEIR